MEKKLILNWLQKASELDDSKTYGLTYDLNLKLTARYMITNNIDTVDGLANGTTGRLQKITYSSNKNIQKVIIAWFNFSDPIIGAVQRSKLHHLHVKTNAPKHLTPIVLISKTFGCYTTQVRRLQIPSYPSEAMTIHKAQGNE